MNLERKLQRKLARQKLKETQGRINCPKCRSKLIEKPGYGIVCQECGWMRKKKEVQL